MKLSVLLLLLLGTRPFEEPPNELTGIVRDESERPIADADILVRPLRGIRPFSARTDSSGRFRLLLGAQESGPFAVAVFADGLVPWAKAEVEAGAKLSVTLSAGRAIEGVVIDARTREPVAGARVEAFGVRPPGAFAPATSPGLGQVRAATNEDGRFRLQGLPATSVTVKASAEGYGRLEVNVAADEDRTELAVLPGVGIRGVVLGPDDEPLEGANVVALQRRRGMSWWPSPIYDETDASGAFALFGVESERYRILVTHEELAFRLVPDVVVESADVELDPIRLDYGRSIVGRFVDVDGEPVSGTVSIGDLDGEWTPVSLMGLAASTEEEGRFRIDHLPPAEYALTFEASGFVAAHETFYLEARAEPYDLGEIVFGDGLAISGFVVDESGVPIENAEVTAGSSAFMVDFARGAVSSGHAVTSSNGTFEIVGLEAKEYRLAATAPGFVNDFREETVEAGATDVVLVLERGGSIRARVVDEEGTAIEHVEVSLTPAPRTRRAGMGRSVESEGGRILLEHLLMGEYVVSVSSQGLRPTRLTRVEIESGEVTDLGTVVLTAGGSIRGWVLDPDDNPLPGARARAGTGTRYFEHEAPTDAAGYFEIAGLEDGVVDVHVSHSDYADAVAQDVEVRAEAGPATIRVRMTRGGRIEGVVRSRDGAGIGGRIVGLGRTGRVPDTTTGPDGTFRIEAVKPGATTVRLLASDPNYAAVVQEREVEVAEGETSFVEFESRQVVVSGQVSKRGVSLGGVSVSFRPEAARGGSGMFVGGGTARPVAGPLALNAVTTPDGYYELYVDAPGAYEVTVTAAAGTTRFPSQNVLIPDVTSHVTDLVLDTASLAGRVVSKETQAPVADARVRAYALETGPAADTLGFSLTDTSGAFRIEIHPGRYRLMVLADGFSPLERTVTASETSPQELLVELDPGQVIRGRVFDANGEVPSHFYLRAVEDAQPTTDPPRFSHWAEVHPDGAFELRDLAPIRYNVLAGSDLDGFAFATGIESGAELTFRLRPAAWIQVRVVNESGVPVPEAQVAVSALAGRKVRDATRRTDAQGMLDLYAPAGSLELKAVKGDDLEGSAVVTVGEGERAPAQIVLRPAPGH
ncbi:MAG TPA: carboxypeptidase regulatory-like domain-containing protein [Vicinamibacteria bacterium]|nr:carboxypeptidase regulatory-like domain-containing protein [Vicinamibacteria bacterium]